MKVLAFLVFDTPLAHLVTLFEWLTGYGFDWPEGTAKRPRLVQVSAGHLQVVPFVAAGFTAVLWAVWAVIR